VQNWCGVRIRGEALERLGANPMIEPDVLKQHLRNAFPEAPVLELEDLTGTKDHYRAVIVHTTFRGKTRIEQHKLVYQALGALMNGPVHALALETRAPE
jgi:stress-induced morphogen